MIGRRVVAKAMLAVRPRVFACAFSLLVAFACGDDADQPGGGGASAGGATSGGGGSAGAPEAGGAGGGASCESLACGADQFCADGACHDCGAPLGTQHDLLLAMGDDEEDRSYFLHVPASYACDHAAPLLVDFHGTAGGDRPEEAYQLDALLSLSEAVGAIVVRPRSRSSERGGQEIYRWDQNPGDLERNVAFTENLVRALRAEYHIDEARTYASGFSSGSNMTSQFLGPSRGLFRGLAPIAGGIWSDPGIEPFGGGEAPRIYLGTGYRDYLYGSMHDLLAVLDEQGVPSDRLLVREYDTGHDLFAWHFPELWAFLDEGERPVHADLSDAWTAEPLPSPASVLTLLTRGDGSVVATGKDGEVWVRDATGAWSDPKTAADGPLTGSCRDGSDRVFFVGETSFVAGSSDLVLDAPKTVPELFGAYFGSSYMNGIGCRDAFPLAAGGYWTGVESADGGASWQALEIDAGGYIAQSAAVHVTDQGTMIATGYYDFIGRGAAGATTLEPRPHPGGAEWLNDVTSAPGGSIWVVGDHGVVLHSDDDGLTFEAQDAGTAEDLYAVAFAADGLAGAAVGRRGTVVVTLDGGATWQDASIGSDVFLGAAVMLGPSDLLVAGEGGLVARVDLTAPGA